MNLIRNYRNWRTYRATVNELGRLSDRGLEDLGQASWDGFRASGQVHDAPILHLRPPLPIGQLMIEAAGGRAIEAKSVPGCRMLTAHKAQSGHGGALR